MPPLFALKVQISAWQARPVPLLPFAFQFSQTGWVAGPEIIMHFIYRTFLFHYILFNCIFAFIKSHLVRFDRWGLSGTTQLVSSALLARSGLGVWMRIRIPEVVWEAVRGSSSSSSCEISSSSIWRPDWRAVSTRASLSARRALAARCETPPQSSLPCLFCSFLLSWQSPRKREWRRKTASTASAIVASAHFWIGFPLLQWKIKVLSGEVLRICD